MDKKVSQGFFSIRAALESNENVFQQTVELILHNAAKEKRLLAEPSLKELREWSEKDETTRSFGQKRVKTKYGSYCFLSRVLSRSAPQTMIVWSEKDGREKRACVKGHAVLNEEHERILREAVKSFEGIDVVTVQRAMGNPSEGMSFQCRLVIPKKIARFALMLDALLFDGDKDKKADMTIVMLPDFPERKILVNPNSNTTFLLGTDYFGEIKKGCLRMISEVIREEYGGYSFHMGLQTRRAGGKSKAIALAGLSGTGKTTLSLNGANKQIHQDDFIFIIPKGKNYSVVGPEKGFYVKTEDLTKESYPGLWKGFTSSGAVLENVLVDEKTGEIETQNHAIKSCPALGLQACKNGRAVVPRNAVPDTNCPTGAKRLCVMGIITRRTDVFPPVVKLSPEQFTAIFCIGPSIKTSAADPKARGEPVMEYGTDPFHIGDKAEYANKLLKFLRGHSEIELVMMNTGRVGKKEEFEGVKITPEDSQAILDALTAETIGWEKDKDFKWLAPKKIPGISKEKLDAKKHYPKQEYEEIRKEILSLYAQQLEKISKEMPGSKLCKEIMRALPKK
ncbi:phosphoenolpyruvate carboxykinase (ATP) [Candidatus Micrarchaeota archaeon]|nr:phosphoenolpyruvate carboxykinase (ATP) [Candidatus Micrarchaeota archaeon]